MNKTIQHRFRPLIEKRLSTLEEKLPYAPTEATPGADVAILTVQDLRGEMARLNHALRRIDGGFYGRCIRCGRDLAVKRLERELDALTCDPCPSMTGLPLRSARRRSSFA